MNYQNRDFCYFHPKQILIGVCPFCLNEKLLVVAAKQGHRGHLRRRRSSHLDGSAQPAQGASNAGGLPKMFALRSLLNRLELRHRHRSRRRSDGCADFASDFQSTSTSLEDSFISIKFEDNGVALWDKSKINPTKPFDAATNTTANTNHTGPTKEGNRKKTTTKSNKTVVEHAKTPRRSLRWRNRIGHLLQLVRWKSSNKSNGGASHVDGAKGVVKGRGKGWIKTFTRRRTN